MREIDIKFTAGNPSLREQLLRQGLKSPCIDHFEKIRGCINYLKAHGYIGITLAYKQHGQLFDQLFKSLEVVKNGKD